MLSFIGVLLTASLALAESFVADKPTTVFSRPDLGAPTLGILKTNRQVEVEKKGSQWIKISLKTAKGRLSAYVRNPEAEEAENIRGWHLGLSLYYSTYFQSSRSFVDTDGNQSDISNLTGGSPYYGLTVVAPYLKNLYFRGAFALRKVEIKGTVKYRSGVVATADTPVEIKQEFYSLSGGAQYFFWRNLWWGAFAEYAMCTKSSVFGIDAEKPSYFLIQPAIGYDFRPWGRLFIQPEFRLGVFVNTKPFMMNPEVVLTSGYLF